MELPQLSNDELARYSRHILIPEFGSQGQQKLKAAKVLVVGSGGLGSPLLLYLAAAGVGNIGIVDFDVVDDSNLQRQVLFDTTNIGQPKAEAAASRLRKLNPYINVTVHNTFLTSANALDIVKDYDLVADGTDNFPTRYLVNDACTILGKPNVYASIFQFDGQVSVFNYTYPDGTTGPDYRDLYPTPPPPGLVPSCAEGGVLGVLPGIIGSLQASEVIKIITGIGQPLVGRLFLFDALSFTTRNLNFKRNANKPTVTQLIDYEQFCGLKEPEEQPVNEITVEELEQWQNLKKDYQLIDVREPFEYDIANLNGTLIPLAQVEEQRDKIERDKPVVVHCKMGGRSAKAIKLLQQKYGYNNLYNLKGGIIAYAKEVDTSLAVY